MCWKHFTVFQSEYEGPRSEGIHAVCFQTPFGKILIDDIQEMQKKSGVCKTDQKKNAVTATLRWVVCAVTTINSQSDQL